MARVKSEETIKKDNLRKRKAYDYGQKVLKRFKCRLGCSNCGYNANAQALQFNHIDPKQKSFLLATRAHYVSYNNHTQSNKLLKPELAKYENHCGTCQLIRIY